MYSIPENLLGEVVVSKVRLAKIINKLSDQIPFYICYVPILICIKDGATSFFKDLSCSLKAKGFRFDVGEMDVGSYDRNKSTGHVGIEYYHGPHLEGRRILVVEDIVDTSGTVVEIHKFLENAGVLSIEFCVLLFKRTQENKEWRYYGLQSINGLPAIRFVGTFIPNKFVVGKGLDYSEYGRELDCVRVLSLRAQKYINQRSEKLP